MFAEALARLPAGAQARAYGLWRQQLQQAAQPLGVPLAVQQVLLEQLRLCFRSTAELPLAPDLQQEQLEPRPSGSAAAAAVPAAAADSQAVGPGDALASAQVHVELREQLPHLLQLLLHLPCAGSAGEAAAAAAAVAAEREGGSRGSGNAPSLSSVQSAAVGARPPPRSRGAPGVTCQAVAPQGDANAAGDDARADVASSGAREAVLRHAVLLIGRLSDPEALADMLGMHLRDGVADAGGGGSDSADEDGAAAGSKRRPVQQPVLSRRDVERVSTAAALIEACLDGMLTLPQLAAAVHQQLHSKGNSSAAAAGAAGEEQQAAAAELRHTAGLLLGMHRELGRLCAGPQLQPGELGPAAAAASGCSTLFVCSRALRTSRR